MRKNGQHDEVAGSPMHLWRPCHRKLWKLDGAHDQPSSRRAIGYGRPMFGVTSRRNGLSRSGHCLSRWARRGEADQAWLPPLQVFPARRAIQSYNESVLRRSRDCDGAVGAGCSRLNSVCLRLSGGACPTSPAWGRELLVSISRLHLFASSSEAGPGRAPAPTS
jgi:hypothetical protein